MTGKINLVILFLLFLSCGSVYLFLFGGEFVLLGLLIFSASSILSKPIYNLKLFKQFLLAVCMMWFILLFNWIVTGFSLSYIEYPKYFLRVFAVNLAMFALYNRSDLSYKNFEWLFKFVVLHATLNFFLGFIGSSLFIIVTSPEGFQASSLFYCFFYMARVTIGGIDFFRNQSFFWEPGVLGFVLNIYLFILLMVKDRPKNFKLIFVICFLIITTFSTTGLGLMVLQFFLYLFKDKISLRKISLTVLACILLLPVFISNLSEKTSGSGEGSFIVRYYDSFIALDIIKAHPVFGLGLSSLKYNNEQMKYPRFLQSDLEEGKPSTNSILATLAAFGIPLGLLILYALYKQRIIPNNRKLLFCFFLIFLASEPLLLSTFFLIFISSVFYKTDDYQITLNNKYEKV